jgi:hypothetical protein
LYSRYSGVSHTVRRHVPDIDTSSLSSTIVCQQQHLHSQQQQQHQCRKKIIDILPEQFQQLRNAQQSAKRKRDLSNNSRW